MPEHHILAFLDRPEGRALVAAPDHFGFTPVQLALRILRPATLDVLLSLTGAGLASLKLDPDGFGPLHRIAGQCLLRRVPLTLPGSHAPRPTPAVAPPPQPADFLAACQRLWRDCLAAGMHVDAVDDTKARNPPLFHFLAHHPRQLNWGWSWGEEDADQDSHCHVTSFDYFFVSADLAARNAAGDTALHVLARGTGLYAGHGASRQKNRQRPRPDAHDARVFDFLVTVKGLDPLREDARGRSALDIAAEGRRNAILDLFRPTA